MNIGIRMSLNTVFNVSFEGCNTSISTNTGINFDMLLYEKIRAITK